MGVQPISRSRRSSFRQLNEGYLPTRSGGQDKFVAKRRRNGQASFQQSLEMRFGCLLKVENRFAPVGSVRVATRQETGFSNPNAVLVASQLDFRNWNDHVVVTLAPLLAESKRAKN
jgi:hypothetical protein